MQPFLYVDECGLKSELSNYGVDLHKINSFFTAIWLSSFLSEHATEV